MARFYLTGPAEVVYIDAAQLNGLVQLILNLILGYFSDLVLLKRSPWIFSEDYKSKLKLMEYLYFGAG